jgi:hypothetical protein
MSRTKKQPSDKGERPDPFKLKCQCIIRKDAAQLLGVTPTAFDHLMRIGKLKFNRCPIGKRLEGYSHAEIIDFLQTSKIEKQNGRYLVVSKTFKPFKLF